MLFSLPPGDIPLGRLFVLNMAACGCELGFASVTTIAPSLLRRHSFSETAMSVTMGIGPVIALLVMPLLGRCTDRCSSRLGRRRPFLLGCALLLLLGISCICAADTLAAVTGGALTAGAILAGSVVVCTFAAQVFFNPYQALISDLCRSEQNACRGFAVFVLMVSLGGINSSLLFAWDWFPDSRVSSTRASFALVALLVAVQTLVTLCSIQEQPWGDRGASPAPTDPLAAQLLEDVGYGSDSSHQSSPALKPRGARPAAASTVASAAATASAAASAAAAVDPVAMATRLYRRFFLTPLAAFFRAICWVLAWPHTLCCRILRSPMALRRLFLVDLMSWVALVSFYMYITDYLGQAFGGRAEDPEGSEGRIKFEAGVRMGAKCLLLDSISSCVFSLFCLNPLQRKFGTRGTYVMCLTTFSVALVFISLTTYPPLIYCLSLLVGCGYSVIGTIPNTLLTLYHYQPEVFFADRVSSEAMGLGENFAILDMSYCLSSIVPSLTLGYVVDVFGMPHLYVLIGGVFGLISAVGATKLIYKADEMPPRTKPLTEI